MDFEVVSKLLQIASAPSSMATTIRLMAGSGLVSEGFKEGQVGSSAMPHKINSRTSERLTGMMVLLRGYNSMAADLAGSQWNEGDVSCSVVRRILIPDSFYVADSILVTFMMILEELQIHRETIQTELKREIPKLVTSEILLMCVKRGMGREKAHKIIKKYALSKNDKKFIEAIAKDDNIPINLEEMKSFLEDVSKLAGASIQQSQDVHKKIKNTLKKKKLNKINYQLK
jgi:adenylosuccinate lyase